MPLSSAHSGAVRCQRDQGRSSALQARCCSSLLLLRYEAIQKNGVGGKVQFTQNAPSAHKQDTPVLLAHPLLFKSFFNFAARWYNKNSCAAWPGPSPSTFLPCPCCCCLRVSSSSAPSPPGTLLSAGWAPGAGWQARTISQINGKCFEDFPFFFTGGGGKMMYRIRACPGLHRHVLQSPPGTHTRTLLHHGASHVSLCLALNSPFPQLPFFWGVFLTIFTWPAAGQQWRWQLGGPQSPERGNARRFQGSGLA